MSDRPSFSLPAAASPFRTPLAVDVWDADFRWREDGCLRDLTIDATWHRVAGALADGDRVLERELFDAMCGWYLLPDARVMATAGTRKQCVVSEPTVSINLEAFVVRSLDHARLAAMASLAVRAFDRTEPRPASLRIGVIGFAEALAALRIDYGSMHACAFARDVARTMWCSAVEASAGLVLGDAPVTRPRENWFVRAKALGLSEPVLQRIRLRGLNHFRLLAITSQPGLARLANCVSDALDPAASSRVDDRRRGAVPKRPNMRDGVAAQLRTRAAMQPWMDEPIGYPVFAREGFDNRTLHDWQVLARHYELGELVIEHTA